MFSHLPIIYQRCSYYVVRAAVPHWNRPQRASTNTTENLVLVESTGSIVQGVCLQGALRVCDLYLFNFEFGYLVNLHC